MTIGKGKYYCIAALLAALVAADFSLAQTSAPSPLQAVQTAFNARKYAEAATAAEQALQTPGLSSADKIRLLTLAADARVQLGTAALPQALATLQTLLDEPGISAAVRIQTLARMADIKIAQLAGQDLEKMDLQPARALLEQAVNLPGLKPEEKMTALNNLAKLSEREDQWDKARSCYQQIDALKINDRARAENFSRIAGTYVAQDDIDKAVAVCVANRVSMVPLLKNINRRDLRDRECHRILDNPQASDGDQWMAFLSLSCLDHHSNDLAAVRAESDKYLPELVKRNPSRLLTALMGKARTQIDTERANPHFIVWVVPQLLSAPRLSEGDYNQFYMTYVNALCSLGDAPKAKELIRAAVEDKRMSPTTRLWARLVSAVADTTENSAKLKAIDEVLAHETKSEIPAKDRAQTICRAGQTAIRLGDEAAARKLFDAYQVLFKPHPRAQVVCTYQNHAPVDVGGWLQSPMVRQATDAAHLDRPYGENLSALLDTDVSVAARNVQGNASGSAAPPATDFYAMCDTEGVSLFFYAYDPQVEKILNGLVAGGSYEFYFAPGERQPYYSFTIGMSEENVDPRAFATMYPNERFRLPSSNDGTFRCQTVPTDKGFATSIFFSWALFYDRLPATGDRWNVESIRWTSAGGFSFGGSESVHNRSSWGDLVFKGLDASALEAIQKRIVYRAAAQYQRDRKPYLSVVGSWADPVLSDPVFYQQKVVPMLQPLDAMAEKVGKEELTPDQIRRLYRDAVPSWMELKYKIAALRRVYLEQMYLRPDPASK